VTSNKVNASYQLTIKKEKGTMRADQTLEGPRFRN